MRVAVLGAGYVGLTHGAVLAEIGNEVAILDIEKSKIDKLKKGEMPIHEPGLKDLLLSGEKAKRIKYSHNLAEGIKHAEVIFICVGTPPKLDGSLNLSFILDSARLIGSTMKDYKLVVLKSTVPVGGTEMIRAALEQAQSSPIAFDVISNPEFLREGKAVDDALFADRIIIGSDNPQATSKLAKLYKPLETRTLSVSPQAAEMTKTACNAFLAMKISFVNQLSELCEKLDVDIEEVTLGLGFDKRIGSAHLKAGLGWGGSCFPKDLDSLLMLAKNNNCELPLVEATKQINVEAVSRFFDILSSKLQGLSGKKIGVLGLSFKADTDDLRGSRSIELINKILQQGGKVLAHDPVSVPSAKRMLPFTVEYVKDSKQVFDQSDAVIVCTEWPEYVELPWEKLIQNMKSPVLLDGRNILDPYEMLAIGYDYYGVGRGVSLDD